MSSFVKSVEKFNNTHRGFIRKSFFYVEIFFLIISIPFVFIISNTFLGLNLKINGLEYSFFGIIVLISWYINHKINSQAKLPRTQRNLYMLFNNSRTFFVISLIAVLFKIIFNLESIPIAFILIYLSFFFIVLFAAKLVGFRFLKMYRAYGYNAHHVLIIADAFSDQIIDKLMEQKEWGFKIRGIVSNSKLIKKKFANNIPVISEGEDLKSILDKKVIDEIIYSKYRIDEDQVKYIMSLCNEVGIIFRLQSTVSPIEHENFQFKTLNDSKFLTLVDGPSNHSSFMLKTIADYYVSIIAMIVLSPLFLLIAIIIKIDSKGPVYFKQERIGLRGRKFILYKFRTMVVDAENILKDLADKNESDGPAFKIKNDPRITRFGRFLRKTGLDELPQLQNVILGQMSLIGPRPPLKSEVKQYERWQLRRLSVKPGITCSWQVAHHRNDVKFENWMKMDLNYIETWSLIKDMRLFFRTIKTMFFAEGR